MQNGQVLLLLTSHRNTSNLTELKAIMISDEETELRIDKHFSSSLLALKVVQDEMLLVCQNDCISLFRINKES